MAIRTKQQQQLTVLSNAQVVPPHSIEQEENVLGSIIIDPCVLRDVKRILDISDFFMVKNQWIYQTMLDMESKGKPIDFGTLAEELNQRGQLAEIGGHAFLSHLLNVVPTAMHASGYAHYIKDDAVSRQLIALGQDLAMIGYDQTTDVLVSLEKARHTVNRMRSATMRGISVPFLSAGSILSTEYSNIIWIVEGMLSVGMSFLGGRPKGGKSWLALQLACAVATGGNFLGKWIKEPGPVLYMALEDYPRRLQSRMQKQSWPTNAKVDFITLDNFGQQIGNLAEGGSERLAYMIEEKKYKLVVIDTFGRAIGQFLRQGDSNDYSVITKALSPIQEMAVEQGCLTLLIDHHNKAAGNNVEPDAIADVIGSMAKGATVDTMLGLYRERGKSGAKLHIVGRDLEDELLLALDFDREHGIWINTGDADQIEITDRRKEIIKAVEDMGRASLKDVSDVTGQDRGNVYRRLQDLVCDGFLRRVQEAKNIFYELNK
jgi:hypothetical protein